MNNVIVNILKQEPLVGEDGLDYIKVIKEILTPRKTYIKGFISGKYRGDKIPDDDEKSDLYDFEIYEAEVNCNSIDDFRKNLPFIFPNDFKNIDSSKKIKAKPFPKSKLPKVLPVIISANNKTFGINVLEPKIFEFSIIRKLHQTDGDQVFGSFNAYITGYVLDYEKEEMEEVVGPIHKIIDFPITTTVPCELSNIETGNTELKGNYMRKEFKCKNHNDTIWGKWEFNGSRNVNSIDVSSGCLENFIGIVGGILFIIFMITILPGLGYFIVFYLVLLLISILSPYLKWIFRGIGVLILVFFISSLIKSFTLSSVNYVPKPLIDDNSRERTEVLNPIIENDIHNHKLNKIKTKDFLVKRFREWNDYDGNTYSGFYTLKMSDIKNASLYKNSLKEDLLTKNDYDQIVFNLKENDKNKLGGLYKLFDSIQSKNKLTKIKFAEMIVSFVQDIPYVLILENSCNPNLYDDRFIRSYLSSSNSKCRGFQRFGINTPIEFLYDLNGDCDTRTLLLYTIFSHYNYDVVLMSSEFYKHSILGINLPLNGLTYEFQNQKYILWETTSPKIKPGLIPNEISNLNNWRISIKSK